MASFSGGTLYAWGTAKGNSLPVSPSAVDAAGDCVYPAPVKCPSGVRFIAVAADMGVFAAIDTNAQLWAWGKERSHFSQAPAMILRDVKQCDVGRTFVICCALSGEVFLIGPSPKSTAESIGKPIKLEGVVGAKQVCACADTLLVLLEDGKVYTCGGGVNNGHGSDAKDLFLLPLPPVTMAALGSRNGAAVDHEGTLWLWGDGYSGCLAQGRRIAHSPPLPVTFFKDAGLRIVHVACTRGQPDPKRIIKPYAAGQEGPRIHVVADDGKLYIAGTTHKGLAGDHLSKTMQPSSDKLTFYRVGGPASDSEKPEVPTGAAEDLRSTPDVAARRMGLRAASDFGLDGQTHYLDASQIVFSQPAHIHSIALDAAGSLYAWGCGSDGRTGLRAYMRGPGGSKRRLKCYVSTPSVVEALEGRRVIAAAAGRYWTIAIVQ